MSSAIPNQSPRIIGGVFALHEPERVNHDSRQWLFQGRNVVHLANARSALCLLAQNLRPKQVWLPSYLCSSVVDGFHAGDANIRFYPVGEDLCCESDEWLQQVEAQDMVLRIHYFGFPNADPVLPKAVANGACLVEDASQALLSDGIGVGAAFVVFSPRKFVGVPDGGCLVVQSPLPNLPVQLPPAPDAWWQESLSAVTLRRNFDNGDGNRDWFIRFRSAETLAPAQPCEMSELTRQLLATGINFDTIALRRRNNYRLLLELLGDIAMFPELPEGVVPLGFPVRIRQRDIIRNSLFEQSIYPPVHWPLESFVPASFQASHRLAAEIMTLPCDQRYEAEDMIRMSLAVRKLLDFHRG
jgi:dTDP-4-amino-4,6-dideoxygalactose transaminase